MEIYTEKQKKVLTAQQYLKDTDYVTNKIAEYTYIDKEITEDYTEILKKREEARQIIRDNRLGGD